MDEEQNKNSNLSDQPLGFVPLRQIRTYQGDVADALHNQKESLVSIQLSESLRRRENGEESPAVVDEAREKRRKDFLFLVLGSIFLLAVGSVGAWYGFKEFQKQSSAPVTVAPMSRFVASNSEVGLNLLSSNREGFATSFEAAIADLGPGELKHVVTRMGEGVTAPLITTQEFFSLLESRAPGSLVRSFNSLFMIGSLGESPFMIIRLDSFENAYAGMLAWETDLASDLAPLFSNTELVKAIGPTSVFKDVIVRNKDVRVLEVVASTTEGMVSQGTLLYSFFDNNMLIITDRIEALQILIDRLTRERLSR